MAILAATTLTLLVVTQPQGEVDERLKPTLSKSDITALNKEAKKWIAAELAWDKKDSASIRKKLRKAKSKFMATFEKKGKKRDLLENMGDVLGIFDAVFPYDRVSTSGEVKQVDVKAADGLPALKYALLAPKKYDPRKSYPSVLVLRGWDAKKKAWTRAKEYLDATWKGMPSMADTFFLVPDLRKGDDYDAKEDLVSDDGMKAERARIGGVLAPFGELQRKYHIDRGRMFLDCGPGTCGFGVRMATYFPTRFAGLILRQPIAVDHLQLESLAGVPVLLVSTADTKPKCEALEKRLNAINGPGNVTIVAASDAPPHFAAAAEIDKWMRKHRRQMYPLEVVVAPNHDAFHKAHWVEMINCEPLDAVSPQERPMVRVKADPKKNRIVITSRSVSELGLYLNDALVDLDKEVSLVINGVELPPTKLPRSLKNVTKYMRKAFDPTFLYPAYYRFEIPKEARKKKDGSDDGDK